jgi:hypothetical protein
MYIKLTTLPQPSAFLKKTFTMKIVAVNSAIVGLVQGTCAFFNSALPPLADFFKDHPINSCQI